MKSSSLMPITESGNAVFAPAVGTRARVIVREVVPPCTIRTVVFAHGTLNGARSTMAPIASSELFVPVVLPGAALLWSKRS